tara:strand:- start:14854 stop:15735 length:882 start_codon:yes stop_codon:yes gene_type:complete
MSDDQTQQVEETNEDNLNLVDVLQDFNEAKGSSEEPVVEDSAKEEVQLEESNVEAEEEKIVDSKSWLIENKFEDTDEGRANLAKSYRELQSKIDKDKVEINKKAEDLERLEKLDSLLKENPNVVSAMKDALNEEQKQVDGPPQKPESYDILDESIDGTESNAWRTKHDEWLITQGRKQAVEEVNNFKQEIALKESQMKELAELQSMGMSDEEIVDYKNFISSEQNLTNETLVQVYRFLKGNRAETNKETNVEQPIVEKRTTAAATTGSTPPVKKTADKEKEDFFNGIMQFSRQ